MPWTAESWSAFVADRMKQNAAVTVRLRKDAAREAVILSLQRWLSAFFDEFPDLARQFPDDTARRALAERVAALVLGGA